MASSFNRNDSSNSKGEQGATDLTLLVSKISELKKQIEAERLAYVREKIMKNKERVERGASYHHMYASTRGLEINNLSLRMRSPLMIIPAIDQRSLAEDINNNEEVISFPATAHLPAVEKLPHFTTWVHTTRNQKTIAPREQKHEFFEDVKRIIRMVISEDYAPTETLLQTLARDIGGTTSEIREEFSRLKKRDSKVMNENVLEKNLASNVDSMTRFCRRCLEFGCKLHGNGQPVIIPAERLGDPARENEEDEGPCSSQCCKHSYKDVVIGADSDIHSWTPHEKNLYLRGVEMYGRNSCLIAKNLLSGFKTCMEVYTNMRNDGPTDVDPKDQENLASGERNGKRKKAGGHSKSRRLGVGEGQSNIQFNPCLCNPICGKDCPCLNNSTCCEKYCGCSKRCKNRFRGCYCLKSQCRSRQCPCFAANRECDPDVCRNCWVSCGGGALGEPQRKGEGQCGNMRILLRQRQRILWGISDVAGWGAFAMKTVEKDTYLGEYTGELISPEEADLRGQLYDRDNLSFLFNLNDQYVIDALRQGNKLKFANHSSDPNCYASIKRVVGEHRIGIFAKKRIEAGEELFLDYYYGPEHSHSLARKPDDANGGPSGPQPRSKRAQPDDPKEGPSVPHQALSKKTQPRR